MFYKKTFYYEKDITLGPTISSQPNKEHNTETMRDDPKNVLALQKCFCSNQNVHESRWLYDV